VVKVNLKLLFGVTLLGELKAPAISLVTVWGASELFSHTTCVPILTVSVAGWKEYISFFSTIFTMITVGLGVGVGLGCKVGVGVGVGCEVAAGVEAVVVPPPPHAAKRKAATIASEKNPQSARVRLVNIERYVFIKVSLLTFQWRLACNYQRMCEALCNEVR